MPREERAFNVKIGDALTTALYSRGIMVPVCVRADVDINISYDEVMESDDFNDIIDIPPDDEK